MKKFLATICLVALILGSIHFEISPPSAHASSTIYINSSTGNDSTGDGSSGNPYKTFYQGYTQAIAGDILDLTGTFTWTDTDETGDASTTGYTISKNLTIQGNGASTTILQAASSDNTADRRVLTIDTGVTATIQDLTIRYGKVSGSSAEGGGILNLGTATVENCEIYSNRIPSGYGGGGLSNQDTLTINTSTIYSNTVNYMGGGVLNSYSVAESGYLTITNSTIYGNSVTAVTAYTEGGGVHFRQGNGTITNTTVVGNTACGVGGVGMDDNTGTVILKNNLFASNLQVVHSYCSNGAYPKDFGFRQSGYGNVTNNGYNIVGSSTQYTFTGNTDWTDTERDGTFTLYGTATTGTLSLDTGLSVNDNQDSGVTTLAITGSGSIAVNNGGTGTNGAINVPTLDQRGAGRSGATDVGAFEYGGDYVVSEPTTQASEVTYSTVEYNATTISWTNGNGSRRIIFLKEDSSGTATPVDTTNYTANSVFGSGDQIGSSGWYAVYEGLGTSVTVTGLSAGTAYIAQVLEYNGITPGAENYFTNTASNNPKTQTTYTPITIYCNSSTGNDSEGDGSSGSPYKTFTKCYTESNAGDTIDATGTFTWTDADETGDASTTGYTIDHDLTITGQDASQTIFQAASSDNTADRRVFTISSGVTFSISGSTIRYGKITTSSAEGGGILNEGTTTITNCELYSNRIPSGNGGGGASNKDKMTVVNSAIYNNTVQYMGGGLLNSYYVTDDGYLNITNSTIYGNSVTAVTAYTEGGGVHYRQGNGTITNTTVTDNTACGVGGVGMDDNTGTVTLKNNLFADNNQVVHSYCSNGAYPKDFGFRQSGYGNVIDNGYNIVGASTQYTFTGTADWTDADRDGTFALYGVGTTGTINFDSTASINDNAYKTTTFGISAGSIAINNGAAGTNGSISVPSTDQRGAGRNSTTDIGSFEFNGDYSVSEPTTQASEVSFSSVDYEQMNVSWTNGDGTKRVVLMKAASSGTATPVDTTAYTASSTFGSGTQIGETGWYAIYNGSGTNVTVTGLDIGTSYIVQVFEYNGIGTNQADYMSASATNNPKFQSTLAVELPTTQASEVSFSSVDYDQMTISWSNGDGTNRVVFVKQGSEGTASPVDDTTYTANTAFGSGTQIGTSGWYAVYKGSGSSVTITGLSLNTNYIAQVFEYNSYSTTISHLTSSASNNPKSQATLALTAPSSQASEVTFSGVSYNQMTINWTNGNGAKRAVFIKAGSEGTASPVDDTTYTANTAFSSGTQIGSTGWYAIYNNTGTGVTVTGLTPETSYIVQVVEYNQYSSQIKYFTDSASNNPKSQATTAVAEPTTQASSIVFSGVAHNQATIGWTNGNGSGRIVFVKEASTGTATPVDDTSYTANTTLGSGTQIGETGWYTVYKGTGTSVTITGLSASTTYIAQVFEYNDYLSTIDFFTDSASNNPKTQITDDEPSQEDFETGNLNTFSWTTGGNANWAVTSADKNGGTYSAVSGDIGNSQNTYLQLTLDIAEAGNITFYKKVSSESGYDKLYFYIDDVLQSSSWSGTVAWSQSTYAVTAGEHTFKWKYQKDGSASVGSDCAWIDDIVFPEIDNGIRTLTYTAGSNGSITGSTPQSITNGEDGTAVTAVPDTGYEFVNWSDESTDNPRTDTSVSEDISVTANFAVATFSLSYAAGSNGSVTGTTSQTVNYGADGTAVTAVPNSGYNFINWSDGITTNPRTDTTVTANVTATANFRSTGTTIYVNSSTGNDSTGTGGIDNPYATFHKGYISAGAGDILDLTGTFTWTDADETGDASESGYTISKNLTITGHGADQTILQAASSDNTADRRVLTIASGTTVTIEDLAIRYGKLTASYVEGGGLLNLGTVTVEDCEIYSNRVPSGYGGGGLSNWKTMTINRSSIYDNTVNYMGGGVLNSYSVADDGYLTITNSTIYGNEVTAVTAYTEGGGVHFRQGSGTITNTTVTNNTACGVGGVGMDDNTGTVILKNNLFAENNQKNHYYCSNGVYPKDFGFRQSYYGNVTDNGYNIIGASQYYTFSNATDWTDTNRDGTFVLYGNSSTTGTVNLADSADINSSPNKTTTYSLESGSIAINRGYGSGQNGSVNIPIIDQRGASRNGSTDIGSYEYGGEFGTNYTLAYSAGVGGSISGESSQTIPSGANGTSVTAVASTGYEFVQWSDESTQNPRTDTNISSNLSVTATFAVPTYTLTYTAGANGSITGSGSQVVNYGATGSGVTAVGSGEYNFINWSDGSVANPRTDTIVTADVTVTANFGLNSYLLSYTAGANGSISGSGSQALELGGTGTAVTAIPNTGYSFVNWSDSSEENPRTDSSVTESIAVTANFTPNTYTLAYTAGSNGSVTGSGSQSVSYSGTGTAVTAVPNAGYEFVKWSDDSTANPRTDSNVTGNVSVTASFAASTYTLSYSYAYHGSVTGSLTQSVSYGGNGTAVTAVPEQGYRFIYWNDGSTANPRTDTSVSSSKTVRAYFVLDTYTLTFSAGSNGSVVGNTSQVMDYGTTGDKVVAIPDTGYHFVRWSDDSTENPRRDTSINSSTSISAVFAIDTYTLNYTAGSNGSLTGSTSQTINYGTSGTAVTAVPNTGYNFVKWSDGSVENPRTDTNENINVSAIFGQGTYALLYTAGSNGSLTGTTSQTVANGSNGTAVTAVANTGYNFINWSDSSTANPRTDTNVSQSLAVTANFTPNTYTLTYTAGSNGALTGSTSQTANYSGSGSTVTAVADSGYHFLNWSDGKTENPRSDTSIRANISVTANFEADKVATTIYANSTTGNDTTGTGSVDNPYKTFHKAYTSASSGDTIDLTGTFTWTDTAETGDNYTSGYTIWKNLTIQGHGPDQTIIQASSKDNSADRRVFTISSGVTTVIQDLAIRYGRTSGYYNEGGGILNNGDTQIIDCEIYSNRATSGSGGGIANRHTLGIYNTTIYNNTAYYMGGGIVNSYYVDPSGYLTISNSTITYNEQTIAIAYTDGGGIHFRKGSGSITNSTISYNTANGIGGVGMDDANGTLTIKNSIIANNYKRDSNYPVDFGFRWTGYGNVVDNGYNIIGNSQNYTWTGTGTWTDQNRDGAFDMYGSTSTGTVSLSTSLAINSNPSKTQTLSTGTGSVAINNGDTSANGNISIPDTDQRGNSRTGATDIGAFEYSSDLADTTAPTISNVDADSATYAATISWTTNESASSQVKYDPGQLYSTSTPITNGDSGVTSHEVTLTDLVACSKYYYSVTSQDSAGNISTDTGNYFFTGGCAGNASVSEITETSALPEYGGTITQTYGGITVNLTIPTSFYDDPTNFQLKSLSSETALGSLDKPTNYNGVGESVFDIKALYDPGTTVSEFESDVTVSMTYTDNDIAGLAESSLWIHRNDNGTWYELDSCDVDTDANTVTCTTNNFSVLGLFGEEEEEVAEEESTTTTTTSGGGAYAGTSVNDDDEDDTTAEDEQATPAGENEQEPIKEKLHVYDFTDLLDLTTADWQYSVIENVAGLGLMTGSANNDEITFNPNGTMNRAEASVIIARYLGFDDTTTLDEQPFADVPADAWYASSVDYLRRNDIIHGKSPEEFAPDDEVTRAEFFKMIVRAYMASHPNIKLEWTTLMTEPIDYFDDVEDENWYAKYMYLAGHMELLTGYLQEDGSRYAMPNQEITRVEGAAMITKITDLND